jgi:thiosulfate/3-mercaptopyruvate sulfurtransferase
METGQHRVCVLPGLLVSTEWLNDYLDAVDLRIVDVRAADLYAERHIPGAVQLELASLAGEVDGVPGMLIGPAAFAAIMGQLGIDETTTVVLYDDNWGMPAARVLWALSYYGHPSVAVLNGGWDRWQEEGRPVSQTPAMPPPARFTPRPLANQLAELAWVQSNLTNSDVVFMDTRTLGEFAQGHLPGAINWDWMNGAAVEGWDAVRPAAELTSELAALGVTPDKEIVTYCRSGARAAHTYLVLRHLGFTRVRNYDGSWLEWSARVLGETHHG